jgi:hypothetical protein
MADFIFSRTRKLTELSTHFLKSPLIMAPRGQFILPGKKSPSVKMTIE